MIVCIGSRSVSKVISTTNAFSKYPELWEEDTIEYMTIPKEIRQDDKIGNQKDTFTGISCIPNGVEEIITGAKNRAKQAYDYAKKERRHL